MDNNYDDHSSDSDNRGPEEHEGSEGTMSQTTERIEQQRFRMERLATGGTSSAMTRDAARLRSVMGQAAERPNDERSIQAVAGNAVMPPLPDLDAPIAAMAVSAVEPDAEPEHHSPAKSATPTGLRPIASAAAKPQSAQTASDGATRMRSVAALGATAPKEEVAPLGATAPKEEKKAMERPRSASRMMLEPSPAGNISRSNFRPPEPRATQSPLTESRPAEPAPQQEPAPATSYGNYRDTPTVAFEPMAYSSPVVPARSRGRMWAIALTVVVGTGLGVGLYAGGGDLISSIFANRNEGVVTDNPSAVTERPQAAQPPPQQAPAPAASALPSQAAGETAGNAEAIQGTTAHPATADLPPQQATGGATTADHNDITTGSRPAAETHDLAAANDIRPGNDPKPARNQEEKKKKPAESDAAREKGSEKDPAKPSPSKFMVQVRATPDEAEANLLAKKLRSKGMGAISVVKSEKDGAKLYRVRFGSFASQSEAQSAATRAGYASVWVIKQK